MPVFRAVVAQTKEHSKRYESYGWLDELSQAEQPTRWVMVQREEGKSSKVVDDEWRSCISISTLTMERRMSAGLGRS